MLKNKIIGVVVPAHNEETQISAVIDTMPAFVDKIIIVDDCSDDNTVDVVNKQLTNKKIILIKHKENQGVGAAIATGYKWAQKNAIDAAVVMAGDGQMDPNDLPAILRPVLEEGVDYTKGNRLFSGEAYKIIPKARYFGNAILSLFTKIASGYWHIADSQSGYTAIGKKALKTIPWDKMYKSYGQPNDLLVLLNVYNMRVRDIPIKPVYGVGEKSGIKIRKVVFTISWLLLKRFFWRVKEKYVIRNFHPLVFFYMFGIVFGLTSIVLFYRVFYFVFILEVDIPKVNALAAMFSFISSCQFILFAMWFDMESNKNLK